jgi:hypothetical protein
MPSRIYTETWSSMAVHNSNKLPCMGEGIIRRPPVSNSWMEVGKGMDPSHSTKTLMIATGSIYQWPTRQLPLSGIVEHRQYRTSRRFWHGVRIEETLLPVLAYWERLRVKTPPKLGLRLPDRADGIATLHGTKITRPSDSDAIRAGGGKEANAKRRGPSPTTLFEGRRREGSKRRRGPSPPASWGRGSSGALQSSTAGYQTK